MRQHQRPTPCNSALHWGTVRLAQLSDPQYDFAWGEYARVPILPMVYAEDGEDWLIVLEPA